MEKILSISIAAYNAEKYIEECVRSITETSAVNDIEVIIVNDGSTDHTLTISEKLRNEFPQSVKIINKSNGGWGSTVNCGIAAASGKYFKLVDADDWVYSENIEKFVGFLKKADCDLVITPFGKFDEKLGKVYAEERYKLQSEKLYDYNLCAGEVLLQMHAITLKTDLLKKSGMNILDKCFYTDVQYVLEASVHCNSMCYLDLLIYKYRQGRDEQSCSREGYIKHYTDHRRVVEYLINYFHENDLSGEKKKVWVKRLKAMGGAQYLIYSYIKDDKRVERLVEWDSWLKKEPEFYDVSSLEARLLRKTNFRNIDLIDGLFTFIKKIAKRFGVDL
jgi:glycosyltransferase involved in cell wall biosynthesis